MLISFWNACGNMHAGKYKTKKHILSEYLKSPIKSYKHAEKYEGRNFEP